jgi:lipopolysaccharide transport system ATP-binding protein
MTEIAIHVNNLSKCYEIYDTPRDRLKQFIVPPVQRLVGRPPAQYFREFWALKDVSFDIKKGETFGIIGRNGSGKSTLLQMICGTLTPTSGNIQTNGRIAALLELGSGFNLEFTGRENIYLNGTVIGLTMEEIETRLDDILAFSDIGDFIDQPVKTYSSGMFVRLAFAIQVNVEPDILIVDEALSVGDFFFQQKCFARLRKMREAGLTLLFVSHDTGTVRDLCPKSIYLVKGHAAFLGDSQMAIGRYLSEGTSGATVDASLSLVEHKNKDISSKAYLENAMKVALWRRDSDSLRSDHRLLAVVVRNEEGELATVIKMGCKMIVEVFFRTKPNENGHVSITIKNRFDQIISCTGSYLLGMNLLSSNDDLFSVFKLEITCMIEAGLYSILIEFGLLKAPNMGEKIDKTEWFGPLKIDWDYESHKAPFLGMFGLPASGQLISCDDFING